MQLNRTKSFIALVLGTLVSFAVHAHETKKVMGLKMPESAIAAKDGRVFVSEIGEFGKEGDGQITVIEKNGESKVFAQGLDDPKGLAIVGKDLYVADNHRIIKVTPDGKTSVFAFFIISEFKAIFIVFPFTISDEQKKPNVFFIKSTISLSLSFSLINIILLYFPINLQISSKLLYIIFKLSSFIISFIKSKEF